MYLRARTTDKLISHQFKCHRSSSKCPGSMPIDLRARTAKRVLNIEVTNIENEIRRQRHPIGVGVFSITY